MLSYKKFLEEYLDILKEIYDTKIVFLNKHITFEDFCKFAYKEQ